MTKQRHRRRVTAVRSAEDADAVAVDVGAPGQLTRRSGDVVDLDDTEVEVDLVEGTLALACGGTSVDSHHQEAVLRERVRRGEGLARTGVAGTGIHREQHRILA